MCVRCRVVASVESSIVDDDSTRIDERSRSDGTIDSREHVEIEVQIHSKNTFYVSQLSNDSIASAVNDADTAQSDDVIVSRRR